MEDFWDDISDLIPKSALQHIHPLSTKRPRPQSVSAKREEPPPKLRAREPRERNSGLVSKDALDPRYHVRGIPRRPMTTTYLYQAVFPYPYLNEIQSQCFQSLYHDRRSMVITAPTGAGKTALLELAICGSLQHGPPKSLIVYFAPLKALCHERYLDWKEKFDSLGLKCKELTGDTKSSVPASCRLVVTTPEKWDMFTRTNKTLASLADRIGLVLIDEVQHLAEDRGATLEAVISRIFLSASSQHLRYVAVSATCPNAQDIGRWLHCRPEDVRCFGNEYRPVRLEIIVKSFAVGKNEYLFQQNLKYKIFELIRQYNDNRPALVFCGTRKDTIASVQQILKEAISFPTLFVPSNEKRGFLRDASLKISDKQLKEAVSRGVGFYHAGLSFPDRKLVQSLFSDGDLMVVCTTTCLAKGVNLPAHLVIIQGTQLYNAGSYEEINIIDVLQMVGRAGRPQFDQSGVAIIMTTDHARSRYQNLVSGQETIDSTLMKWIPTFLNTEIAIGTVQSIQRAQDWLLSTFLYRRIQADPGTYQVPQGLSETKLVEFLKELLLFAVQDLKTAEMIKIKPQGLLMPLESGICMSRYSIAFETMKLFQEVDHQSPNMTNLILTLSRADEFSNTALRRSEKSCLNALHAKVKYQLEIIGKRKNKLKLIQAPEEKLFVLIQAVLGELDIEEWSLKQEATQAIGVLLRVTKGALSYFITKSKRRIIENVILFHQSLSQKLWFDSPHVCRQVEKIGKKFSEALVGRGITTLPQLAQEDPRVIEEIVNRNIPFGNKVHEALQKIWPRFSLSFARSAHQLVVRAVAQAPVPRSSKWGAGNYSTLLVYAEGTEEPLFVSHTVPNFSERPFETLVPVGPTNIHCHLFNNDFIGMNVTAIFTVDGDIPSPGAPTNPRVEEFVDMLEEEEEDVLVGHNDGQESFEDMLSSYTYRGSSSKEVTPRASPAISNCADTLVDQLAQLYEEEKAKRIALEKRLLDLEQRLMPPSQAPPRRQTNPCTPSLPPMGESVIPMNPEGRSSSRWFAMAKQHAKKK